MSVKSPSVGRRKRAAMRQDQSDTMKSPLTAVAGRRNRVKSVLVVDVGGTSVKILATGQSESRSFPSGPKLTPNSMVARVKKLAADWTYDVVSIGYPGPVLGGRPAAEPVNLGRGWIAFDFAQAFGRPVKVMNDAAMQALGSYEGGKMLFLGLGTGLGTALIVDGMVKPWSSAICRTRKAPTRITSDVPAWSATVRRSGGVMWPTSLSASSRRCGLTKR